MLSSIFIFGCGMKDGNEHGEISVVLVLTSKALVS